MLKNYFLVAFRGIIKNKGYSFLNILGLSVGMTAFILIFLYVRFELSYDRWHENADRIYRIAQKQEGNMYLGMDSFAVTPAPLAKALARDFAEVESSVMIDRMGSALISFEDKNFMEDNVFFAEPGIFDVFSLTLIRGDTEKALVDPDSILFSESAARKYFGENDPMGKTISFMEKHDMKVTGIFKDMPKNSHFVMDMLAPFKSLSVLLDNDLEDWDSSSYYSYCLLRKGVDPDFLESKLPAFLKKYRGAGEEGHREKPARLFFQPLTKIHLFSHINFDIGVNNSITTVFLFGTIAFLILIIACINYMNLATARSAKRAKEVGMRKVVGARRSQLVLQFLGESTLLTLISMGFTAGFVVLTLPAFNNYVEREISFNPIKNPWLIVGSLGVFLLVGLVAGSYPAAYVSGIRPIAALKKLRSGKQGRPLFRSLLVVFQFSISILLILCTVTVHRQLHFIRNMDVGFNREHIVILQIRDQDMRKNLQIFKNDLAKIPDVLSVSLSNSLPNRIGSKTNAKWPGKSEDIRIPIYSLNVDYDFLDVFDLKLAEGRNFSRDYPADVQGAFLINEAARKALGWEDPIGRPFGRPESPGRIVGVVKDFHMHSVHQAIEPLQISLSPERCRRLSIRIRSTNIPRALASIEKTWHRFSRKYPFEYSFFDDVFDRAYKEEQKLGQMFSTFGLLAVFIACLGLFGLSAYTAETRTREIGIRKVMGASEPNIVILLSMEYVKKVLLSALISWPLGYFAMKTWLRNFVYRVDLGMAPFFLSGLAALAVALLTVSYQTLRAASVDPVISLRYE